MTQETESDLDLFISELCELEQTPGLPTVQQWTDLWCRWFICRYSELKSQIRIEGSFGENEDGPPSVCAVHDDIVDRDGLEGGSCGPEVLLEDVIASYFEIHELDEVEAAIRAAVERGIAKGRELYPE